MKKNSKDFFMSTPFAGDNRFIEGEPNLFNNGQRLEITHLATDYSVAFSAFLDNLSDAYTSEWTEEDSYGRMDPIGNFMMTRRNISVSWRVPAASFEQAKDNLDKMNKIVSFLYPLYGKAGSSQSNFIKMGPYWKVKFGNLICNSLDGGPLLGWVNGITVDPLFEEGVFMLNGDSLPGVDVQSAPLRNNPNAGGVNYYPKGYRLNFEMTVLHEHSVGWKKNVEGDFIFRGKTGRSTEEKNFPYRSAAGVNKEDTLKFPRKSQDSIDETDLTRAQVLSSPLGNPGNNPNDPSKILFDANGERALWWEAKHEATIGGARTTLQPAGPNVEYYEKENPVGLSFARDIMNPAEERKS